ncbi:MAG: heme-binding domain-containing protein, partial [Anaerolineales bacterium]|nr:heme-binding domain-containing protein [Anaerolineales bacterium]
GREAERERELTEVISEGEMPPAIYLLQHGSARLTDAEKQQLIDGLMRSR